MRTIFTIAFLTIAGHARRVQVAFEERDRSAEKSLAAVLLAMQPSIGMHPERLQAKSTSLETHPALAAAARSTLQRSPSTRMALDYKDPVVAEEFAVVNALDVEEVEAELNMNGLVVSPAMSAMDMKMMLVELRLIKAGKAGGSKKTQTQKQKPSSYANAFEEALWEKPAFKELYESWQKSRNTNSLNLATEYLIDKELAATRYAGTDYYAKTLEQVEAALNAKVELTSPKISYSGFPSSMGEMGIKMALAAFGELVDFSVQESEDGRTCYGTAEWDDIENAKSAIDKYDGMDMGVGECLELQPFSR